MIVPVRNAAVTLERQLECLANQDYGGDWEVIVSDNGSIDGSAGVARGFVGRIPGLRVVDASGRRGASHARNVAASVARGEFLAFCDADDEVTSGWLSALTEAACGADMVGGWYDGVTLNRPQLLGSETTDAAIDVPDRLAVQHDFLPYAVGTSCGIWATVLEAVGGWNEQYLRSNDVELSWRVQLRGGGTLGFAPAAVVRKRCRATGRAMVPQYFGWGRADAQLYRDFHDQGLKRSSVRNALRRCGRLLVRLPDFLRGGPPRGEWLAEAAHQWGRVWGSLRYRVRYL